MAESLAAAEEISMDAALLSEDQITRKAFLGGQNVFALFVTGFGKNLINNCHTSELALWR